VIPALRDADTDADADADQARPSVPLPSLGRAALIEDAWMHLSLAINAINHSDADNSLSWLLTVDISGL
jgi:hypothetical protein